jgi:hypothetical protein
MVAESAVTFGATFAALYGAHMVADHWIQTDHQAKHKGERGSVRGWLALLGHVATYTLTAAVFVGLLAWRTGIELDPVRVGLALLVSAITHGWADRRHPLAWLARLTGKSQRGAKGEMTGFYHQASYGINGAYLLDQSWHVGWLFIAALIAA